MPLKCHRAFIQPSPRLPSYQHFTTILYHSFSLSVHLALFPRPFEEKVTDSIPLDSAVLTVDFKSRTPSYPLTYNLSAVIKIRKLTWIQCHLCTAPIQILRMIPVTSFIIPAPAQEHMLRLMPVSLVFLNLEQFLSLCLSQRRRF